MIVPSMTLREIRDHLLQDVKAIYDSFIVRKKREFERRCLKATTFPYYWPCNTTTPKKNCFYVNFTARKRGGFKKPYISVYALYLREEGYYAAALVKGIMIVYPPHFFQRYRERILHNEKLPSTETIHTFFKEDWGFEGCVLEDKGFNAAYHCFEKDSPDDKISCAAANSQGYCFIEKQGDVFIVKTIISEDMLYDDQKDLFHRLKTRYDSSTPY